MKFIKKNLKIFIAFVTGAILTCGITVYANSISARQVTYNNKTVEQALNELYSNTTSSGITSGASGKTNSLSCQVGDYYFIQNVYGFDEYNGTEGISGCQILATCVGPATYGVDSTGILVKATSTTISCPNQFGYIKLVVYTNKTYTGITSNGSGKTNSLSCQLGDYYLIQNVFGFDEEWNSNIIGGEVLATCVGPAHSVQGVDSTGILVRATSTTISCSAEFGYIKLGIQ